MSSAITPTAASAPAFSDAYPDFEIIGMTLTFDDETPTVEMEFCKATETEPPVIHLEIPEHSKYVNTFRFVVRNRTLKGIKYTQVVRKGGFPFKTRHVDFDLEYAPNDASTGPAFYSIDLPAEETPGGFLVRGRYTATSTYTLGEEVLLESPFTLEIVKRRK